MYVCRCIWCKLRTRVRKFAVHWGRTCKLSMCSVYKSPILGFCVGLVLVRVRVRVSVSFRVDVLGLYDLLKCVCVCLFLCVLAWCWCIVAKRLNGSSWFFGVRGTTQNSYFALAGIRIRPRKWSCGLAVGLEKLRRCCLFSVWSFASRSAIPAIAVADAGGSLCSYELHSPRTSHHCIKPLTIMLSFCFLPDYTV